MGVGREGGGDSSSTKRKGICKRARSGFIVSGAHRATRSSLFRQKFHFLCVSSRHGFANWQNGHTQRAKLKKRRGKKKNLVESGKEGKKKNIFGILSPQNREHQKRYLFIYLLIGKRESGPLLLLWILFFFALYVPTQPPTTQKATAPFALTHEDMTCYHFRPKKKKNNLRWKIIWHASPPRGNGFSVPLR